MQNSVYHSIVDHAPYGIAVFALSDQNTLDFELISLNSVFNEYFPLSSKHKRLSELISSAKNNLEHLQLLTEFKKSTFKWIHDSHKGSFEFNAYAIEKNKLVLNVHPTQHHAQGFEKESLSKKLLQLEDSLNLIFYHSPLGLGIFDEKGFLKSINDRLMEVTKMPKDALLSLALFEISYNSIGDKLKELISNKSEQLEEIISYQLHGEEIFVKLMAKAIYNEQGDPIGGLIQLEDWKQNKLITQKLIVSEKRYAELATQNQTVTWEVNIEGLYTYLSENCKDVYGYEAIELVGRKYFYDLFPKNDRESIKEFGLKVIEQKESLKNFENQLIKKDGKKVWVTSNGFTVTNQEGQAIGFRGWDTAIDEKKKQEQALQASEEKFRLMTEVSAELIWQINEEGIITYLSPAANNLLQYSPFEMIGRHFIEFIDPKMAKKAISLYEQTLKGESALIDINILTKKKESIPFELSVTPMYSKDKKIIGVQGIGRDIRKRKETELQLSQVNSGLIEAQRIAKLGSWEYDLLINKLIWSEQTFYNTGFDPSAGEPDFEHFTKNIHPADQEIFLHHINLATVDGLAFQMSLRHRKKNNQYNFTIFKAEPLWHNGQIVKLIGTSLDITERKLLEDELQAERNFLNQVLKTNVSAITVLDANGKIVFANESAALLLGIEQLGEKSYSYQATINRQNFLNGKELKEEEMPFRRILNGEAYIQDAQYELIKKDESKIYVSITGAPIKNQEGEIVNVVFSFIDISSQIIAERQQADQAKYQAALTAISSAFVKINAKNADELVQQMLIDTAHVFDSDRNYIFEFSPSGKYLSCSYEWSKKDDWRKIEKLQHVELGDEDLWKSSLSADGYFLVEDLASLDKNNPFKKSIFKHKQLKSLIAIPVNIGNEICCLLIFENYQQSRKWTGLQINYLQMIANILADARIKIKAEEELLASIERAEEANKTKSEFLANMSHEIRTPLNAVIGFSELLQQSPLSTAQEQYVNNVSSAAHSLLGVINDILDFSKIEAGKLELEIIPTSIHNIINNSVDIIKYQASKKGLELYVDIDPEIPDTAMLDPTRLKQILINLLSNAVKFTDKGSVKIQVLFREIDEFEGEFTFSVIDSGIGIKPDQQAKLFQAFSQADNSTTRLFGGTGLGLIISNLLAEKMNSKISFDSEYEKGSHFYFTIKTSFNKQKESKAEIRKHDKHILVIEDDSINRAILEKLLGHFQLAYSIGKNINKEFEHIIRQYSNILILINFSIFQKEEKEIMSLIKKLEKENHSNTISIAMMIPSSLDMSSLRLSKKGNHIHFINKPITQSDLKELIEQGKGESNKVEEAEIRHDKLASSGNDSVLIVEDVDMNLLLLKSVIKNIYPNIKILEAKNGRECLKIAEKDLPSVIIMDLQMPLMDGFEAAKKIRNANNKKLSATPIIALTAGALQSEKEKSKLSGMNDFLTKPINQQAIKAVLSQYIALPVQNKESEKRPKSVSNIADHYNKAELTKHVGEDQSFINELFQNGIPIIEESHQKLKKAIDELDEKNIKQLSHKIKGVALNLRLNSLALIAKEIENNKQAGKLIKLYEQLLSEYHYVCEFILPDELNEKSR